jgi:hypothetical protein
MAEFFTARVSKVVGAKKSKTAQVVLELLEQRLTGRLARVVVLGARTKGKAKGQLVPFEGAFVGHLVLDVDFVRKLRPESILHVEWETRCKRLMTNIVAVTASADVWQPLEGD